MGTTVVVTAKCQAGHIFKFASSREVNGLYVNSLRSAAATLLLRYKTSYGDGSIKHSLSYNDL